LPEAGLSDATSGAYLPVGKCCVKEIWMPTWPSLAAAREEDVNLPNRLPLARATMRRTIWRLGCAGLARLFLNTAVRMGYPFAPILSRGLGVPLTSLTSSLAISQGAGMFGLITGPMADSWGRRRMMLVGLTSLAGGMLFAGAFPALTSVLLAFLLAGLAKTFYDPALQAYVGDWVPYERRGRAVGLLEFSWAGSLLFGVPLIALSISRLGWRSPFLLLGTGGLVGVAIILAAFPRGRQLKRDAGGAVKLLQAWGQFSKESAAWWVLLFGLLIGAANLNLFVVYGAWLEQSFDLTVIALGTTGFVIGIAELLGEGLTALASDRLGLKRAVVVGTILLVLSYCLLPWSEQSLTLTLVCLFIVFLSFEFVVVTFLSLATEILPKARATMISALLVAGSLGRAIGASAGATVWQQGGLTATSTVSAVVTAVALACLVWGLRNWRVCELSMEP
jgi:predicted MFS family arabinose efflux permease